MASKKYKEEKYCIRTYDDHLGLYTWPLNKECATFPIKDSKDIKEYNIQNAIAYRTLAFELLERAHEAEGAAKGNLTYYNKEAYAEQILKMTEENEYTLIEEGEPIIVDGTKMLTDFIIKNFLKED